MLDTLDRMLDDAIRGDFQESLYDESRLSALETRMAHYLSSSAVSARNLAEEKDAIKTLIGDISHQTKHPHRQPPAVRLSCWRSRSLPPEQPGARSPPWSGRRRSCRFLIDALVKTSRLETRRPGHGAQAPWPGPAAAGGRGGPGRPQGGGQSGITLTVEPTGRLSRPVRPQVDGGGPV